MRHINTLHKYDFICISETYFYSSVESDDDDLRTNGYKLIRMDHPLNTKGGSVCIYYKESLGESNQNDKYLLFTRMLILCSNDR